MDALTLTIDLVQAAVLPIHHDAEYKRLKEEGYDDIVATTSALASKKNGLVTFGSILLGVIVTVAPIVVAVARAWCLSADFKKRAKPSAEIEDQLRLIDIEEREIIDGLSDDLVQVLIDLSVDEISALYDEMLAAHLIPEDRAFENQRAAMKNGDQNEWDNGDWVLEQDNDGNVIPRGSYEKLFERLGHRESTRHEGGGMGSTVGVSGVIAQELPQDVKANTHFNGSAKLAATPLLATMHTSICREIITDSSSTTWRLLNVKLLTTKVTAIGVFVADYRTRIKARLADLNAWRVKLKAERGKDDERATMKYYFTDQETLVYWEGAIAFTEAIAMCLVRVWVYTAG